jgi:hypothetical protein
VSSAWEALLALGLLLAQELVRWLRERSRPRVGCLVCDGPGADAGGRGGSPPHPVHRPAEPDGGPSGRMRPFADPAGEDRNERKTPEFPPQ